MIERGPRGPRRPNAQDTTTETAVGTRLGTFDADASGQATYRLPLELPPGIASFAPELAIAFGSRTPNGTLGVGFSLSGPSTITRVKATYAVDGFNGAVSYGAEDRYALDGQRLINVEGDYGSPGALYYTEIQSWQHVRAGASESEGFTVVTAAGETRRYGGTEDSRILALGGSGVRVWALSSMTDRNGNRVEWSYTLAPGGGAAEGAYYLDEIRYTARDDTAPNRFVRFTYEARPDVIFDYVGGYPVRVSQRLRAITVSLGDSEIVRTYTIEYGTSNATQLSRVEAITLSGASAQGGPAMPPTTFEWQDVASPGFDIGPVSTLDQHLQGVGLKTMDVTGRGATDLVQLWADTDGSIHATTYLATPGDSGVRFERAADTNLGSYPTTREILPLDADGDGRTDLLVVWPSGPDNVLKLEAWLSDGQGGFTSAGIFDTGDTWSSKHISFFAMDANGDGRTDLVEAFGHYDPDQGDLLYFRTYLSLMGDGTGRLFTPGIESPTDDPASPTNVLAFWPMDVNGDGMIDLVRVRQRGTDGSIVVTAYVGVSRSLTDVTFAGKVETDLGTFALPDQIAFFPVDVNGDGVQDLLQIWQEPGPSGTKLHFSTFLSTAAGGFVAGPDTVFEDQPLDKGSFFPMDLDGSGLTAIVHKWVSGDDRLMFTAFRTSPSGVFRRADPFDAGTVGSAIANTEFVPADANADGKADLLRLAMNGQQQVEVVPYASSGPYPDLVTAITNPLGARTTIAYAPLSDDSVYSPVALPVFPQGSARRFPNPITPTQFPCQAVLGRATYVVARTAKSTVEAVNRFSLSGQTSFSYAAAAIDLLGHGWLGFATVTNLDETNGRVTTRAYNQPFPMSGTVASTTVTANGRYATDPRVPPDDTAVLMTRSTLEYNTFVRATGVTAPHPQVVEVLPSTARQDYFDYGADRFDFALANTFDYDDYGNQTLDANLGYVGEQSLLPLFPDEVVYHRRLFQNQVSADGWTLGLLRYSKDTSNATEDDITVFRQGDYHLEQRTYLQTTLNLWTRGMWDDVHGSYQTVTYGYDDYGNQTIETSPGGATTRYDYDPDYHTYKMRVTAPPDETGYSAVTLQGYDPRFGALVASTDANRFTAVSVLDAFGRKSAAQGPVPDGTVGDRNELTPLVTGSAEIRASFLAAEVVTTEQLTYASDGEGGLYSQTEALQSFPTTEARDFLWDRTYFDGEGRSREEAKQTGQPQGDVVILKSYTAGGQISSQSLPFFSKTLVVSSAPHATVTDYDVLARMIRASRPMGERGDEQSITTWTYGAGGLVTEVTASGSSSEYTRALEHHFYDKKDRVRRVTANPAGQNGVSIFRYDPIGRLLESVDPPTAANPAGISSTTAYDSLDRRRWFDNPDQNTTGNPEVRAMTYEYDPSSGMLARQTDAAGAVTTFRFDGLGRMTQRSLPDGRTVELLYDVAAGNGRGRLSQTTVRLASGEVQSQVALGYDAWGNVADRALTVIGESAPFVTRTVSDPQRRIVQQTNPDQSSLVRSYSSGVLVSQSLDGALAEYTPEMYSAWRKPDRMVYGRGTVPGEGIVLQYSENPSGQVIRETFTSAGTTLIDGSYSYDLQSQLLAMTDAVTGDASASFTYLDRRLATAAVAGAGAGYYTYDAAGDLVLKDGVTFTMRAHFPVSGRSGDEEVYSAGQDPCGRMSTRTTGGRTLTFEYDGLGSLSRVAEGDTTLRRMISDDQGNLLQETLADGTTVLRVSSGYQVVRRGGGDPVVRKYLQDDRGTVASIEGSGDSKVVRYFRHDFKGSNTHEIGSDGAVVTVIAYGGYGEPRLVQGSEAFQPQYEQRPWDADLGLSYFGSRWYDPATGRYIAPDTQVGASDLYRADVLNRFAFELNNPVNAVDPTGHSLWWLLGLAIAVALVVAAAAIILTGGAAAPFVAIGFSEGAAAIAGGALTGAMLGAGINAGIYSVTHRDASAGKFWGGYFVNLGVGAVVGGVTGGVFSALGGAVDGFLAARTLSVGWQFAARAAAYVIVGSPLTAAGDTLLQFMSNVTDRYVIGDKDVHLSDGLARSAATGAIFGAVAGVGQAAAEVSFLRRVGGQPDPEGIELQEMSSTPAEGTSLLQTRPRDYGSTWSRERLVLPDTFRVRAVLFAVSEGSAVVDASLEAAGY